MANKAILEGGKRYAIVSASSKRIRDVYSTPKGEENGKNHTLPLPDGHYAIEIEGASTGMIGAKVDAFPLVETALAEKIKASAKNASASKSDASK